MGGRAQRLPPNALVARNALQMLTWRSFVVVVVVIVLVVVVIVVVAVVLKKKAGRGGGGRSASPTMHSL